MIIPLKKYLFFGPKNALAEFLIEAQSEGFIEFITDKDKKQFSKDVHNLVEAIKILRKQPIKEPYEEEEENLAHADEIATEVIGLKEQIEKLREEKRYLEAEIARVAPFGEFSFEDIDFIQKYGKKKIQFYCVKTTKSHVVEDADDLIFIGTDYDLDYYIGIHDQPKSYPGMIEMQVDHTALQYKNHLVFVNETEHQLEAELKGFAGHIDFLHRALLQKLDRYNLEKTKRSAEFPIEASVFSIQGWVPKNKIQKLQTLIGDRPIYFELIATEAQDKTPTYMENKGTPRLGEDLVKVFDIPSSNDIDPSGWVMWSFAVFFAMIIADAGYGLIYLALTLFIHFKFPHLKENGKRFVKLMFILSISCIIWGLLTFNFFSIQFSPNNQIARYSPLRFLAEKKADYIVEHKGSTYQEWIEEYPKVAQAKTGQEAFVLAAKVEDNKKVSYPMLTDLSNDIVLELSLLIGVIHISMALLRYARRNWANFGWVFFAIGGYLYFPIYLKTLSFVEFLHILPPNIARLIGLQLLFGGIGSAIILAIIQKRWLGLAEIPQVVQIFADILSYLRLYALALAGSIMSGTFNELGVAAGLVFGFLIILVGHSINLLLSTMGGVIHGLRLNFVEWYRYCFEGEGKLFNPLRKLKKNQE